MPIPPELQAMLDREIAYTSKRQLDREALIRVAVMAGARAGIRYTQQIIKETK